MGIEEEAGDRANSLNLLRKTLAGLENAQI